MKDLNPIRSRAWLKAVDRMDLWLDNEGYYRKHTAKDGSCLFRAVSEQIFLTQLFHVECRRQIVDFMLRNEEHFQKMMSCPLMEYAEKMYSPREWGGQIEIEAMSLMYKCDFLMFKDIEKPLENVTNNGFDHKLMLCYSLDKHYDPVYTKEYISVAAFCQSTVYEMLYKRVFELKEVDYAVKKMLHNKTSRYQREHIPPFLSSGFVMRLEMRDNFLNVKELLDLGITPFPYKVAKSLDVDIYRNVEYDTWNEYRKGLRYGYCAWTCQDIQVGAKCLVKHEGNNWHGHVQEMQPNKGPVVVFVEELGEMRTVPYNTLELLQPTSPSAKLVKPILPVKLYPLHFMELQNAVAKKTFKNTIGRTKTANDLDLNIQIEKSNRNSTDEKSSLSPVISSSEFPEQDTAYQEKTCPPQHYQTEEQICPESSKPDPVTGLQPAGYQVYQEVVHPPTSLNLSTQEQTPLYQAHVTVNLMAPRSINPDGSDLPHSDVQTLRFFYNLGLDHMRMNNYVVRQGAAYYVTTPSVVPTNTVPLESPLPAYEAYSYSVQGGGKRQNTFEGTPLIQHSEVSSTTCPSGSSTSAQQQQQQTQHTPAPVTVPSQLAYYQPTPVIPNGTPECDSQYCVPPSLTSTYSYDYSYDYPLYIQSPHSMVPSSYIGPDGLLYQTTVISNAPAVIQTAPPQVQTNIHTM